MSNKSISSLPEWDALQSHQDSISQDSITSLFAGSDNRFDDFHVEFDGVLFDYSKHHLNAKTISLLLDLARARDLEGWRERMVGGECLNNSEERSVLHMALRGSTAKSLMVDGENVANFVSDTLVQIKTISDHIRSNDEITDVINIGVGGSDLASRLVCDAFKHQSSGPRVHFLANVDGHKVSDLLQHLDPTKTVVVIASKSFGTLETMMNAQTVRSWFVQHHSEDAISDHFYAITTNMEAAAEFGIVQDQAIGLPIAIAFGFDGFQSFLDGAASIDQHFLNAPLESNIPVLMGLIGVWYNNFWGYQTHCILPYSQSLNKFSAYIQQLDMESNGKSVTRDGVRVDYATSPAVFGEPGTNGQHAFYQMLHQGTHIIPSDFIAFGVPNHDLPHHHESLLANALAQSHALMEGSSNKDEPHRNFEGSRPNSMLLLDSLDLHHLGMLMAIYEHKVFVQGVIWNVNSFDQWGVELGKKLAKPITEALEKRQPVDQYNSSTNSLSETLLAKNS